MNPKLVEELNLRLSELDMDLVEAKAMANRADELADECETPEGEAILRSEADNLWYLVGTIHDRIERIHDSLALISAGQMAG